MKDADDRQPDAVPAEAGPEDRRLDLRLAPAAGAAWASGFAAVAAGEAGAWALAAGAFAIAVVTGLVGSTSSRSRLRATAASLALAAVAAAFIASLAAIQHPLRLPSELADRLHGSGRVAIEATITSLGSSSDGSTRVRATLTSVDGLAVHAPVLLFLPREEPGPVPEIGTGIGGAVTLRAADPGDRVVALGFLAAAPTTLEPPHPLLALGSAIRSDFADAARELPGPGGALVPGLALGDERHVPDELREAMTISSLTHLTAVSGSNVAIIVGAIVGLGRLAGWRRGVRLAAAGMALALFVLLVTPQGSVLRAAAMAAIVLALEARSRPVAGVPVLCAAIIALLGADPWLARDYGFALSAAATAGLLLGARPCTEFLARWLPVPIALLIAVPLVAQLACQPILLLLDATLPTYGVLANLLAAPAAPLATVVGLVACLIGALAPPIGAALMWVAWLPAQWIGLVAQASAGLPFASLPWLAGLVGALAFAAVTVAGVVLAGEVGGARYRRLRQAVAAALVIIVVVLAAMTAGEGAVIARDRPADWRVIACDVGQGDALLLRAGDAIVLIDTGEDAAVLGECLSEFGIARIDLLVLSHFDHDHSGATVGIRVPIGAAWLPDTLEARTQTETLALAAARIPIHFAGAGDVLVLGDLELRALWPQRRGTAPSRLTSNEGSLVIHAASTRACTASCLSVLFLGDADEDAQRGLLRRVDAVRADVVKMSHHGSADQYSGLYAQLDSRLAILSVGSQNGYGHPTPAALDLLAMARTPWLRTDERGHLVVAEASGELLVWTSRTPAPPARPRAAAGGPAQQLSAAGRDAPRCRRHAPNAGSPRRRAGR